MAQVRDNYRRYRQWLAAGAPRCEHGRVEQERYLAADTGDVGCLDCGLSWAHDRQPPTYDEARRI